MGHVDRKFVINTVARREHYKMIGRIINDERLKDIRFTELNPADWMSACITHYPQHHQYKVMLPGKPMEEFLEKYIQMAMNNEPFEGNYRDFANPLVQLMTKRIWEQIIQADIFSGDFYADYEMAGNSIQLTTTDFFVFHM